MGLCPACLLRQGLGGSRPSLFSVPTPDDLGAFFPGLEILEMIGRGGMGIVYKARQRDLDRVVALKILPAAPDSDPAFAERFTREARALAKLSHPHIVAIHDFGQRDGLYFFLMEYVDGANLRQAMGAGQMSPEAAMAIVPQICDALQYAHDQGIVHRDIKPENVLVEKGGRVKIADFGLAKILANPNDITLTQAGAVMGTTHYMAPEQVERPESVDRRADIFSLGVVFYQMLTGELPIGRFAPPSRTVKLDVRIDEVVLRALENKPELRFPQAGDVKSEVEHIRSTPAPPPPTPPPIPQTTTKQPSRLSLTFRLAVFLLTIVFVVAAANRMGFLRKIYTATTTIQLRQGPIGFLASATGGVDPRYAEIALQTITSKQILEPLINSLGQAGHKATDIQDLRSAISFRPIRNTNLFQLSVSGPDPVVAANWVNAIAKEYERVRKEEQEEWISKSLSQLQEEIEKQRQKVAALRSDAEQAAKAANYVDPALGEVDSGNLEALLPKLQQAKSEEARFVRAGLGDSHPNVKAVRAQIESLEKLVAENPTLRGTPPQQYTDAKEKYLNAKRILNAAEEKLSSETISNAAPEKVVVIWERAEPNTRPSNPFLPLLLLLIMCGAIGGAILALLPWPKPIACCQLVLLALASIPFGTAPASTVLAVSPSPGQTGPPSAVPAATPTQIPPTVPTPGPQSKVARISIGGDVRSPQLLDYADDLTLTRAIMAAGGLAEYADQKKVRLTRDGKTSIINLHEIRKDPAKDIPLKPGDTIEVPQSIW
jgi:serine/threonine protein kinase